MAIKDLRDELAMSLESDFIPTIESPEAIPEIAELINVQVDLDDFVSLIEFTAAYQAWYRYKYADAMLNARK
jgi:hypothetical protein